MLVRTIQELTKNRVKVILENDFSFVLYKGEVRLYRIKEGQEILSKDYDEIMNVVLPKRAKMRAMNLLKSRPYTVMKLREKLAQGGYPENIIDLALDYVSSFHYVDDLQYARDFIYTYKSTKNKNKIIQDLYLKGVSKDLIYEALELELGDESKSFEEEQIIKFLKKKGYSKNETPYEEKMKIMAALYRKGFDSELCRKMLSLDITI